MFIPPGMTTLPSAAINYQATTTLGASSSPSPLVVSSNAMTPPGKTLLVPSPHPQHHHRTQQQQQQQQQRRPSNLVTLNVGGTLFRTTRTTLCADKESLLYRMFAVAESSGGMYQPAPPPPHSASGGGGGDDFGVGGIAYSLTVAVAGGPTDGEVENWSEVANPSTHDRGGNGFVTPTGGGMLRATRSGSHYSSGTSSPVPPVKHPQHHHRLNSSSGVVVTQPPPQQQQHVYDFFPVDVDEDGHVFIDCDAIYFAPILNFLRLNEVVIPPNVSSKGVLAAAQYFNVQGVMDYFNRDKRQVVFSWGTGGSGELGTLDRTDVLTPTIVNIVPYHTRVLEVALGANYSCVLTSTGQVVTFGNGDWGQLGLGPPKHFHEKTDDKMPMVTIPTVVPKLETKRVRSVATGYAYAMALTEDHEVYFWGNNNHGQSGLGAKHFGPAFRKIEEPELIVALQGKRIIQLGCGSFFVIALSEDGSMYSWGLVDCLGQGFPEAVRAETNTEDFTESISKDKRAVFLTPRRVAMPTTPEGGAPLAKHRVVRISAGQWHSCAITASGELYTWGVGFQGRLGHGSKEPCYVPTKVTGPLESHRVIDVSCGSFHTVALTHQGAVFCWGDNANGQCGSSTLPEAVTKPHLVASLSVVGGGFARSISCGRQHTAVVMSGPHPWCERYCCRLRHDGKPQADHGQVYVFGESKGMGLGTSQKVCSAKLVPGMEVYNVNRVVSGLHHMFVLSEMIPPEPTA